MKVLIIAAVAAQVATASAAVTIAVTNNNLAATNYVTNATGTTLAQGTAVAAIGYFSVTDENITDFTSFVQVGTASGYVNFHSLAPGYFDGTVEFDDLGVDAAAVSETAYIVIGDNTTDITQSTNWLVWKTNETYETGAPGGPSGVGLINGTGTLIKGDYAKFQANGNQSFSLAAVTAVPEPSSFALLGLGAAAMIFRRKK